jgi:hypothetical protein
MMPGWERAPRIGWVYSKEQRPLGRMSNTQDSDFFHPEKD